MRPPGFAYFQPESVDAAVAVLAEHAGGARVLAGGQSLLPLLNRRQLRPAALVDLRRLTDELRHVSHVDGELRIGALARHVDLERFAPPTGFEVLPRAARLIGHLPIRTRGTVGGSIAHADPAAEWCLLAVLLDAQVDLRGTAGPRTVAATDFLTGAHTTAATPDEVVVRVRFPQPAPGAALVEFAPQHGDLPLVAAAAALDLAADGTVRAARIALAGVADRPVRLAGAEQALLGATPDEKAIRHVASIVVKEIDPPSDRRADAGYRAELAGALLTRALRESAQSPFAQSHALEAQR